MGLIKKDYIDGVTPTSAQNLNDIQAAIVTLEEQTGREANMALKKVNYIEGETPITAQNLNDIQDAVLGLEEHVVSYEAGAEDFGLKGKGQGELVHFENVHPIEHRVEVAVSDPTAKVKVSGKNLLNINREFGTLTSGNSNASIRKDFDYTKYYLGLAITNYYYPTFIEATIEDNTITYKGKSTPYYGIAFPFKVMPNTVYSFSCIVSADKARQGVGVSFYDKDGAYISDIINTPFTTPSNCYTAVFILRAPDTTNTYTASDIQIEYGTTPTEYTEYIEPTEYTAAADGTVEGVKSISPVMNLSTDKAGAVIDAECFLDPQAVITSLTNTVITLGGEV